jgi:FkbM family methyltransferase
VVAPRSFADLIFDVGFHRGEDTDFYLKKGFRVVAVEANPALYGAGTERFRSDIESGRLTMLNVAIADEDGPVRFFVNSRATEWGTIRAEFAARNTELGAQSREITVPGVRFERILGEFGVPYYLKIDIEGADLLCLQGLARMKERPTHLSLESSKTSWSALLAEFAHLRTLGYRRFKVVSQEGVPQQRCPHPAREGRFVEHRFTRGASGAFGEEAPGEWLSEKDAIARYRRVFLQYRLFGDCGWLTERTLRRPVLWRLIKYLPRADWYDTHATR